MIDLEAINYEPTGTLHIDTRRISAPEFDDWRKSQKRKVWEKERLKYDTTMEYPSEKDLAFRLGVPRTTVSSWLNRGLGSCWAAAFRLWLFEGVEIVFEVAPMEVCNAVIHSVGSQTALGEAIGRAQHSIEYWQYIGGAKTRGGCGPLMWMLFNDMGLTPLEELPPAAKRRYGRGDVKSIRNQSKNGVSADVLGERYGCTPKHIRRIVNRDYYKWVD